MEFSNNNGANVDCPSQPNNVDNQISDETVEDRNYVTKNKRAVDAATKGDQTNQAQQLVHYRTDGAMSVTGQLYETKLLTLFLLRLLSTKVEFYLGANISGVGALDDVCFKYKPANSDKHIVVFLQAKHRVNINKGKIRMADIKNYDGDFSVQKHFESYMMIRQKFTTKSKDVIFKDTYHDSRCFFVVYTPLTHNIGCRRPLEQNDTNDNVKDLIQTNTTGDIFQLEYDHFEFLKKQLVEKKIRQLGKELFAYILEGNAKTEDIKFVKMYRVVLAQSVVEAIKETADDVRYKFRREFFHSKDNFTTLLRESLYDEAINAYNTTDEEIISFMYDFLNDNIAPKNDKIAYNENSELFTNQFVLLEDKINNCCSDLDLLQIVKADPVLVRNIKGRKVLEKLVFTMPHTFINNDLSLKGDVDKIESRLKFLSKNIPKLLENALHSNGKNYVDVNEGMFGPKRIARGLVECDGGLGSAVGNLLVMDEDTGAFKFNVCSPLPKHANILWNKLKQAHDEHLLVTYRFKFRIDCFPKTSFQDDLYEEYLVKDFISQYWLCTGQDKENNVEDKAKERINTILKAQIGKQSMLRAKSDAVFLMLHDTVQKWWLLLVADYLTENTAYFNDAMSKVSGDVLLSVLNYICVETFKAITMEFDENVVKSLGLEASHSLVLIVTDSVSHTAVKIMQHYKHSQKCAFIDFNYVTSLLYCDLAHEVKNSNFNNFIIILKPTYDLENNTKTLARFISNVAHTMETNKKKRNITVVIDIDLSVVLKEELSCAYHEVRDYKNGLIDLSPSSKEKILNEYIVMYQGKEVPLKSIIGDKSHLITSHILENIINKEVIHIGKPLATSSYNNMKLFYIDRYLSCRVRRPVAFNDNNLSDQNTDDKQSLVERHKVKTLKDLAQNIVVVTAPAGMGKSTLLTHLSLATKNMYPNVWIARINLLDHTKLFREWHQSNTNIDKAETLSFLYKSVLYDCEFLTANLFSNKGMDTFKLQMKLFIKLCNNGEVIFVFDGFDEICPLYEREVIQLIKTTATIASNDLQDTVKEPKLWIASRSYNNVKDVIEREFGLSYSLEPLTENCRRLYLNKYWKHLMKVEDFTHDQFLKVTAFLKYMNEFCYTDDTIAMKLNAKGSSFYPTTSVERLKPIHVSLYGVFVMATEYFLHELKTIALPPAIEELTEQWCQDDRIITLNQLQVARLKQSSDGELTTGSPLHTHISAEYLWNEIKYNLLNKDSNWDLDTNTFSLYKRFLETKLTKIRFEDKNGIDVSKPDSKLIYDNVHAEFIDVHRMLGLYALFRDEAEQIMTVDEMSRVKRMIEEIKYATEKTGVIDCIVDDVPVFVHRTFAEYFAADYICEALKNAYASQQLDRLETLWDFIVTTVLVRDSVGVSGFLDYILFNDDELSSGGVNEEETKRIVFKCLMKQTRDKPGSRTAVNCAVSGKLKATAMYLLRCIEGRLQSDDLKYFKNLVNNDLLWIALRNGYEDFVELVTNIVQSFDQLTSDRFILNIFRKHIPPANPDDEIREVETVNWILCKSWIF